MSSGTFTISSGPGATAEEIAVVREGLHQFNFSATGLRHVQTVTLLVRDGAGAIRGGLLGYAELPDYPPGHRDYQMRKLFEAEGAPRRRALPSRGPVPRGPGA